MTGCVLDCSIALSWCFEDEASHQSDKILDLVQGHGAIVPSLWHLEVGNVLLQSQKRGRITVSDIAARVELLSLLPIKTDNGTHFHALQGIMSLAAAEKLTTYDAAYLDLAMRYALPLATKDKALQKACNRIGVSSI